MPETLNELMTRKQAAERLRISLPTLCRHMAEGRISFYKVGFRTLFDENQLSIFLARCERPAREVKRKSHRAQ